MKLICFEFLEQSRKSVFWEAERHFDEALSEVDKVEMPLLLVVEEIVNEMLFLFGFEPKLMIPHKSDEIRYRQFIVENLHRLLELSEDVVIQLIEILLHLQQTNHSVFGSVYFVEEGHLLFEFVDRMVEGDHQANQHHLHSLQTQRVLESELELEGLLLSTLHLIDASEKRMHEDLFDQRSLRGIFLKEPSEQALSFCTQLCFEF